MKYETVEPIDAKLNIWKVKPQCRSFVTLSNFVVMSHKAKIWSIQKPKMFFSHCK